MNEILFSSARPIALRDGTNETNGTNETPAPPVMGQETVLIRKAHRVGLLSHSSHSSHNPLTGKE